MAYLADIDLQKQNPDAALPLLEKAIHDDPGIEQAHLDLGILYADAGRHEDALRELMVAANWPRRMSTCTGGWGGFTAAWARTDEAKAEFGKANQINKKADDALLNQIDAAAINVRPAAPASL